MTAFPYTSKASIYVRFSFGRLRRLRVAALPMLVLRSLHFQLRQLRLSIYLVYLSMVRLLHFALLHFSPSPSLFSLSLSFF